MGCNSVSSQIASIQLRAAPFNITIIHIYAPTTDHDDNEIKIFCEQLQAVIEQTPKKNVFVVQGDLNAKVGEDVASHWQVTYVHYCNAE